jgi:hypothetical protein
MKCKHKEIHWYSKRPDRASQYGSSVCDEAGWYCIDCKTVLGFRPDLDRKFTELKVFGIMTDAYDAGIIYVSNGTERDCIMCNVAFRCGQEKTYDALSILKFILEDANIGIESHAEFWKKEASRGSQKEEAKK